MRAGALFSALALVVLWAPAALAKGPPTSGPADRKEVLDKAFKFLDANGDGKIDRAEFDRQMPQLFQRFIAERWRGAARGPEHRYGPDWQGPGRHGMGVERWHRGPWAWGGERPSERPCGPCWQVPGWRGMDKERGHRAPWAWDGERPFERPCGPCWQGPGWRGMGMERWLDRMIDEKVDRAVSRAFHRMGKEGSRFAPPGPVGFQRGPGRPGCPLGPPPPPPPPPARPAPETRSPSPEAKPPAGPPADVRPPRPRVERRFGPAAGPPELPFGLGRFLIEALDVNKDGKIDEKEIAEAANSLRKLDRNGNGVLDPRDAAQASPRAAAGPR
jgi:hypothetical protein